ncbi:CYTH domain-containing protein [Candidatus Saccharibacteria bacterium]|nr:CYTH domain-containing protein [Candidatus Saccharibacteria bacterium]
MSNANIMKRVSVKVRVRDLAELERRMNEISLEFQPVMYQHDRIFIQRGFKHGMNMPRLVMRTEMTAADKPAVYKLILKRHIEDSGIEIAYRTMIGDYTEMVGILQQLGFVLDSEVSRKRRKIELSETSRIYLDKVDKLDDSYLKIETALGPEDKVSEVMADLKRTLKLFHLDSADITQKPYFELLKSRDIIDAK